MAHYWWYREVISIFTCGMSTKYLILLKVSESGANGRTIPLCVVQEWFSAVAEPDPVMPTIAWWVFPSAKLSSARAFPLRFAYFSFSSSSDIEGWDLPYAANSKQNLLNFRYFHYLKNEQTSLRGTHASGILVQEWRDNWRALQIQAMRLSRSSTTLLLGRLHGTRGIAHLESHLRQSYSKFCPSCAPTSHLLIWHSGHTSTGRSSSPISTTSSLYLSIQKQRSTRLMKKQQWVVL